MIPRLLAITLLAAPMAAEAASPRQTNIQRFADRVIRYVLSDDADMRDKRYLSFFTPRLRAAIAADGKRSFTAFRTESRGGPPSPISDGYGVIDEEPICLCQTAEGVTILARSITANSTVVTVSTDVRRPGTKISHMVWHLAYIERHWAIADIAGYHGSSSLLGKLEQHNKDESKVR